MSVDAWRYDSLSRRLRSVGWRLGSGRRRASRLFADVRHKRAKRRQDADVIVVWRPDHRRTSPRRERESKQLKKRRHRSRRMLRARAQSQRPIGGARRRHPGRPRGPIAPIRPVPTKNVASGPKIMICRGRRRRRRRSNGPRLTRTRPSPSFSSFVRYLRNKPTNANSCAIAAAEASQQMVGRRSGNP